ncbi:uncharacterized protein M6B38_138780 [Iris pallida]|uniref:DUF641 domain-containing protein n=1 Tax=Iris pallida TaxID=29817 RepID=A0AAX6FEJ1_IRIPA|nr:uncharacterized protein M6B38_138780 [Iris pallida]
MASKVANISDLIQRVASSCLTNPIVGCAARQTIGDAMIEDEEEEEEEEEQESKSTEKEEEEEDDSLVRIWEEEEEEEANALRSKRCGGSIGMKEVLERVKEMEAFMSEVFEAVSAVKRAYVSLQAAHCPWDPDRMRAADASVVAELRRLGRLRDRFRRGGAAAPAVPGAAAPLREVVAPYEAALEDLKKELKAKEAEVDNLREKLRTAAAAATPPRGGGSGTGRKMGRFHSSNSKVGCISSLGSPVAPTGELFETCMQEVKSASKSFTANLLSLMRSARWDIVAATRSIIDGSNDSTGNLTIPDVDPHHAKHALESYINRKIFCGFENETFYIEGSLSSLLNPSEFRRECFARFRDMRAMDPAEILGILPTCQFGKFSGKKYLSIVHPKMEESLFGGVEQRRQVLAGAHPRTGFYGEFLRLAKAVWLLHLLAFALDPSPSHFEASKGAEFHPEYMESVVRFPGGRVPPGFVVGFSVGPGFKLGNGSVVRARVYLLPRA